jgi:hypothetical protein
MNTPPPSRPAPLHVPVLTEVVELDDVAPPAPSEALPVLPQAPAIGSLAVPTPLRAAPAAPAPLAAPVAAPLGPPRPAPAGLSFDEAQMTQRVLVEVQRQIDGMLEYRLREALAPILARTSEALVRELRQELSKTMRDVASRAVAQEVVRQRSR